MEAGQACEGVKTRDDAGSPIPEPINLVILDVQWGWATTIGVRVWLRGSRRWVGPCGRRTKDAFLCRFAGL